MNEIDFLTILPLLVAVSLGFYEGRTRVRKFVVIVSGATILGISNLLLCWSSFGSDPSTWWPIYRSGLFWGAGLISLVIMVLPFLIAYFIGRRFGRKGNDEAGSEEQP